MGFKEYQELEEVDISMDVIDGLLQVSSGDSLQWLPIKENLICGAKDTILVVLRMASKML